MGVFDYLVCEHPLPDGFDPKGIEFQTKDTDEQWLTTYRLRADGVLLDPEGAQVEHHGTLEFYSGNVCAGGPDGKGGRIFATEDDEPPWRAEYVALFDHGRLLKLEGHREFVDTAGWIPRVELFQRWEAEHNAKQERSVHSEDSTIETRRNDDSAT